MHRTHESVAAARIDGLVVTAAENEVLVYDTERHHLHHLNHISAGIWRLCDGRRNVADLVRDTQLQVTGEVTEESVRLALTKLATANLLQGERNADFSDIGQSRRSFLRRSAITGAIAVPVIVSMSARPAAAQASGCLTPSQCNASTVGQRCATTPDNCQTSGLACWPIPGSLGVYFCGAEPD